MSDLVFLFSVYFFVGFAFQIAAISEIRRLSIAFSLLDRIKYIIFWPLVLLVAVFEKFLRQR